MRRSLLTLVLAALAVPASAQLAGTYTVGGALPNYATISAAVADLNSLGISGPVTFQVRPGTYDEQVTITSFPRLGAADDVVAFTRSAPLAAPPVWRASAAGSSTNWVVRLNGADYVEFAGFEFEAVGAVHGRLVTFENEATHNTVRNCTFTGIPGAAADTGSLLWADNTANDDNTVSGSTFTHGYVGLDFNDSLTPFNTRTTVTGSTFASQTERGIEITGPGSIVDGNQVSSWAASNASYRGIYVWGSGSGSTPTQITANEVDLSIGDVGIWLGSTSTTQRLIANNTVALRSDGTAAIYLEYGDVDVVHNTAIIAQGATSASALFVEDSGVVNDVVLANNLLIDDAGGNALRAPGGQIEASDTNNLYSSVGGTYIGFGGSGYSTLSAYQSASGLDANSVAVAVAFADPPPGTPDLHLGGASLDDGALIGVPFAAVTTDIDGDARDAYNPKMGADEGTPLPPLDNADAPSGFYAVAGSSPDFADPTEAFDALKARGMKGPVTFRIRPGTFPFRESLPTSIRVGPAASDPAGSLLAIRGANPSNKPVLVSDAAPGTNWALRLRGLDHVELNNLVFDASAAGNDGRLLDLDEGLDGEGADDVTVLNSSFIGAASGASSNARALIWGDVDVHDRFSVTGSTFTDGWAGAYFSDGAGTSGNNLDGVFAGNTFDGQTAFGLFLGDFGGVVVDGNTFSSSASTATAVWLAYNQGYTVTGNQISMTGTSSDGVLLLGPDPGTSGTALVANNFVRADQPLVLSTGATGARVVHNTFYARGDAPAPLTLVDASSTIAELTNNILLSAVSGPALVLYDAANLQASDGNVLYPGAGAILVVAGGTPHATLVSWQAASGLDANSRSFPLAFQNAGVGDLHLAASSDGDPRLAGQPGTGILADFDGEARNADNPTIGADEATPLLPLAGTYDVGTPPPGFPAAAYATLQEGLDAVHYLGVSDDVTLRFHDDFGGFPVTVRPFDGAAEDQRLVVLPYVPANQFTYSPTDAASNGAIRVEGADHVTLGYMFIDLTGGTGGHGQALRLEGEIDDLRLPFFGGFGIPGALSLEAALIGGATATTTDLLIEHGYFSGGSSAVRLSGGDAGPSSGTTILNSDFLDQRAAGVHLTDHDGVAIEDVEITSDRANADGIVLVDGTGASITRARVHLTGTSGTASYAVWLNEQSGTPAEPVTITNSFLTGADQAVVLNLVDHVRIAHNTLRALDATFGGVFRSAVEGGTNQQLVNNILVHEDGGAVLSVDDSGAIVELGANDLYTTGATFADWDGTAYADLAAFQAGTVYGDEAVSVPVTFADAAAGDLHLAGASDGDTALRGTPLADVTDDVDLEARSLVAPYLGADEAATSIDPPPVVAIVVDGDRGARYFGPPATGVTVDSLAAQNLVRGVPGYYETYPAPTLWTEYDPVGGAWLPTHGAGYELPLGRAFRWEMIDQDGVGDPTISESVALPFTLQTHQAPNDEDLLLELNTAGNRFNHLANPFGQPLDLTGATGWAGGAGIRSALYAYDDADAAWELAPDEIGPWEAFRFRAAGPRRNGNPRLMIIPASAQVPAAAPATREGLEAPAGAGLEAHALTFALSGRTATGRPLGDRMLTVAFADTASAAFAMDEDVEKFQPPARSYALLGARVDGQVLGLDARPWAPAEVPLALDARGAAGDLTLRWDASALPAGLPVVLVDLETGLEHDVRTQSSVTFPAASRPALADVPAHDLVPTGAVADRFVLRIGDAVAAAEAAVTELGLEAPAPNPTASTARVGFALPEAGPVRLAVYDVRGREVAVLVDRALEAGRHEAGLDAGGLAAGVYVVRLEAGGQVLTQRATVVR